VEAAEGVEARVKVAEATKAAETLVKVAAAAATMVAGCPVRVAARLRAPSAWV
jgi:hypothetical protein